MEKVFLLDGARPEEKENLTLALGDFDGVHLGHQFLIKEGLSFASGNPFGVFLFDKDPSCFLDNGKGKTFLSSLEDKLDYLEDAGAKLAYIIEVSKSFFSLNPRQFIERCLLPLGVKKVVVGEDYRFGKNAEGTPETLKEYFEVHVSELMLQNKEKIASRSIKKLIQDGKIQEANALLGHPYRVKGKVEEGFHNGRKIGFPTINLEPSFPYLKPKNGVYIGLAEVDGGLYDSIINVGTNPTIGLLKNPILEAHLKGYDGNAYGKSCKVSFLSFLREEKKFDGLEGLKDQLAKDLASLP